MAHTRDLYKTKLCTLFQRGNCPRQSCSFAHGDGELRRFSSAMGGATPINGRGDSGYRSGDLRERLERRRSPPLRRRSPGSRDVRSRPGHYDRNLSPRDRGARSRTRTPPIRRRASRSPSAQRSTPQKRREIKRVRVDTVDAAHFSDVSGENHGADDIVADGDFRPQMQRTPSPTPNDTMENQLRQIQTAYGELLDEKSRLQHTLGEALRESKELVAQNQELESRLLGANDDYKRLGLKMKGFLKHYTRYIHAQDVASKTQTKLQQLAEELTLEDGEGFNVQAHGSDLDVGSDVEVERGTLHPSVLTKHGRVIERVGANHLPPPPALATDESVMGGIVSRRTVPTFIRQLNRESEEESDTHEDGTRHPASKLQGIVATGAQNPQKNSNRLSVHQNGYRITEVDDGDWNTKPSVRLSLANATDKSEKDKVKEEFFVPLESKAIHRIGTHTSMSSRNPPVEKILDSLQFSSSSLSPHGELTPRQPLVKVREILSLPPTIMNSHAREFDLEQRGTPLRGSVEMSGADGDGVNVNLSLSSRAYRANGNEPSGSLLPSSLTIPSSHNAQYKRHGEDLDMAVGVIADLSNIRDSNGRELLVEASSLPT